MAQTVITVRASGEGSLRSLELLGPCDLTLHPGKTSTSWLKLLRSYCCCSMGWEPGGPVKAKTFSRGEKSHVSGGTGQMTSVQGTGAAADPTGQDEGLDTRHCVLPRVYEVLPLGVKPGWKWATLTCAWVGAVQKDQWEKRHDQLQLNTES